MNGNNIQKNTNEKINRLKVKNSVNSTSFSKLKANEKQFGFSESVKSKKDNKQIPFFFLGPENNWKKILDEDFKNKLKNKKTIFFISHKKEILGKCNKIIEIKSGKIKIIKNV